MEVAKCTSDMIEVGGSRQKKFYESLMNILSYIIFHVIKRRYLFAIVLY